MAKTKDNIRATADIQSDLQNLMAEYGSARGAIADLEGRIDAKHRAGDAENVATLARKLSQARQHEGDVGNRMAALEDELEAAKERDDRAAKAERAGKVPEIRAAAAKARVAASKVDDALQALGDAWTELDMAAREARTLAGADGIDAMNHIRGARPLQHAMRRIELSGRPLTQRIELNAPRLKPETFAAAVGGRIASFDKIADKFESEHEGGTQ